MYDLKRHRTLLKRYKDFKNKSKSLYDENQDEALELLSYGKEVEQMIFWQQRYKVEKLMQDFVNKAIDSEEYCDKIFGIYPNLMIASEQFRVALEAKEVKNLQPEPRAKKVDSFFIQLL